MKRCALLIAALILFGGCCFAEADAGALYDIAAQYGAQIADISVSDVLNSPQNVLERIFDAVSAPVRDALSRLKFVVLPVALLMVMQAGMGEGAGAPLLACRMAVLIGCIAVAQPAVHAAQDCIMRVMDFSDAAAPIVAAALTAGGMAGRAAIVSPAAAMVGDICQKAYADWGILLTKVALCLSAAGGLSQTMDLSGLIRILQRLVNWGAGLIGSLFAALITYAGANAFAQDTVAMRAAKYAFDSASGIIGGTSDLWGGSIAGVQALRSAFGFGGSIAVLAVCLQPMAQMLLALVSLRLLSALLSLFGDGRTAKAVDHLSGACRMALMLSCSAAAIVIVLIGSAAGIIGAIG